MGFFNKITRAFMFFNKMRFKQFGKRSLLRKPFKIYGAKHISIMDRCTIHKNIRLEAIDTWNGQKYNPIIYIDSGVNIHYSCSIIAAGNNKIYIGKDALIASRVFITNENHGLSPKSDCYLENDLLTDDVIIENGCWIGENVVILPGVKIGEKSIIGAGSIVTKSIPSFTIAVGNPAKPIKRFNFDKNEWVKINE